MAALTDKQLTAQIRNWRKKKIDGPAYGIRTDQEFSGNPRLEIDGTTYTVADCQSDLEARELLAEAGDKGIVMLFRVGHQQLGEDLLARLSKERLLSVDSRQSLRELFQAASIDPRILSNPKLVDALVAAAAAKGGIASALGVLDMDLAWSVLLGRPEITHRRPDLVTLLKWSLSDDDWFCVRNLEPELRSAFFEWVADRAGDAARYLEAAEATGHSETLIPIGLALGVLFQDGRPNANDQLEGRVRIEDFLGKQKIPAAPAMAWHLAAVAVMKELPSLDKGAVAKRLDHLLKAVKIESLAVHSDYSEMGFNERVQNFAEHLQSYGRRKVEEAGRELCAAFLAVRNHVLANEPKHKQRLHRAEMGMRLAVWLKGRSSEVVEPASLEVAMTNYLEQIAFVDRARFNLCGGDTTDASLSQVYHQLTKQAAKLRQDQQRAFGGLLASWNETGSHGKLLPVENVIGEVVAPLSKERPVLLLVLDGMSGPVFHELLEEFAQREWMPVSKGTASYARPVLAALPSVTEVSRKALFSGKLDHSDKTSEQVAFRDHPALAHLSAKSKPQLFLKGDLSNAGQSFLSDSVRESIASPAQRVVAVLLNVVDDQLSAADQLEVRWRISQIRFLEAILEAASQAERLIVLTSDHGHIPDLNQTSKSAENAGGGDRYRTTTGKPVGAGEIVIQGERIQAATGKDSIILACEETVRYGSKKAGYHGGIADLEVIIPLVVLDSQNEVMENWTAHDLASPSWWKWKESLGGSDEQIYKPIQKRTKAKTPKVDSSQEDLPLFGTTAKKAEPVPSSTWIKDLLSSSVFAQQAEIMGKQAPKNEQIIAFLGSMEKRGNSVLLATLSADLGMPVFRLRGLLSTLCRLLNVDGYAVVQEDRDSETITLDRKLLAKQFEITA